MRFASRSERQLEARGVEVRSPTVDSDALVGLDVWLGSWYFNPLVTVVVKVRPGSQAATSQIVQSSAVIERKSSARSSVDQSD